MLAHAIAHVEARHGTKQATHAQIANQAAIPLIFMGGRNGLAARRDGSPAIPLGLRKQWQESEADADRLGARLMDAAGFNVPTPAASGHPRTAGIAARRPTRKTKSSSPSGKIVTRGMQNTKIVATLGPAIDAPGVLRQLIAAGVDVFRLNASHGTQDEHAGAHRRGARRRPRGRTSTSAFCSICRAPRSASAVSKTAAATLETGAIFTITTEPVLGTCERASTGYARFAHDVQPGDRVLLADGSIELRGARDRRRQRAHRRGQRRPHQRSQGHQPARRAGEHPVAHRKGSGRSAVRPHRRRRHGGALLRAHAPTTCDSCATGWAAGPIADRRQDRKAGGLGEHRSHPRRHRRRDGGARRSGRGDLAREGAAHPEIDHPARAPQGPLRDHRHPDAGIDDREPDAHARRGQRRRQRHLRRHRRGDALRRDLAWASIPVEAVRFMARIAAESEDSIRRKGFQDPPHQRRTRPARKSWPTPPTMRRAIPAPRPSWCSRRAARARGWFRATVRRWRSSRSRRTIPPPASFPSATASTPLLAPDVASTDEMLGQMDRVLVERRLSARTANWWSSWPGSRWDARAPPI